MLERAELLKGVTYSPNLMHPAFQASHERLRRSLVENIKLASHVIELESQLSNQRSSVQSQLLSTRALERQWRQKQAQMDHALGPFSPSSLYQRLNQGLQEQEMVCSAIEESFLEGDGSGPLSSERGAVDWFRKYRDAKKLQYLRQERKERWDEGRVGGWR